MKEKMRFRDNEYKTQEFTPAKEKFNGMDVWVTNDPYIQCRLEVNGKIRAVDYSTICTANVDNEYAICVSGEFQKLPDLTKAILLNREYLRYQYEDTVNNYFTKSSVMSIIDEDDENCRIILSSKEMDFRINTYLYAIYGKRAVDKALRVSADNRLLDSEAMKEFRHYQRIMTEAAVYSFFAGIKAKFSPATV